jgi:hypothetical protein
MSAQFENSRYTIYQKIYSTFELVVDKPSDPLIPLYVTIGVVGAGGVIALAVVLSTSAAATAPAATAPAASSTTP